MKCYSEWLRITDGHGFLVKQDIYRDAANTINEEKVRTCKTYHNRREVPSDFEDVQNKFKILEAIALHYEVSVSTAFRWRKEHKKSKEIPNG